MAGAAEDQQLCNTTVDGAKDSSSDQCLNPIATLCEQYVQSTEQDEKVHLKKKRFQKCFSC